MRKSTRRKLKVYAVDAAMILLAAQVTVVLKADNKAEASTYTTIQAIQDEQAETESDAETPENDTKYNSASKDELNWNNKDSDILLRIAMAEAEGEGTEGKALVMKVVLNRVESREFPNSIEDVVFQPGQFEPVLDDGRYWNVEPDAECYKALYMVQCESWDDTEGALYFCRTGSSPWMENNTEYLFTMENHSFYR